MGILSARSAITKVSAAKGFLLMINWEEKPKKVYMKYDD